MTAIADLVAFLLSAGISAESVSTAVDLAQLHANEQVEIHGKSAEPPQKSAETADERRKRKDRERKQKIAEAKKAALILTSSSTESKKLPVEEVKKERRTREKKRLGPLPENWQPPDSAYPLAIECGTTVPHVDAVFRDYLKSSGKQYADHDAAFCNFVRNQNKFNGNRNGKNDGRRTVHDAAKDLLAKVRSFDAEPPGGICDGAGKPPLRLLSSG